MNLPPPPPPGRPGQSWTSGAKDAVTTALTGRVWATVGRGIVNEVYWPAVDQPQVKDLGFLVVGPPGWREVKRVGRYRVLPHENPSVPLTTVVHTGDFYRLTLRVVPDPDHDALLVAYELVGQGGGAGEELRLYPLLAPHLCRSAPTEDAQVPWLGADNHAWVDDDQGLGARDDAAERFVCLLADGGFVRASAGYVGFSDGWTDLATNGAMTWTYSAAGPGTVALMGELVAPAGAASGVLALGFGSDAGMARAAAGSGLAAGVTAAVRTVTRQWSDWAATLTFPGPGAGVPPGVDDAVRQSAAVLRMNEDRATAGAIVAGLAVPWGDATNDPGGYHLVWCRDSCETALALAALGDPGAGTRLLGYLAALQHPDPDCDYAQAAAWRRCYFVDGTPLPGAVQLDEVAFPVLLAATLAEQGVALPDGCEEMMRRAGVYLARCGPTRGVDRWEETQGASPFTLALEIVALLAAAERMENPERDYLRSLADNWNERLEQFTYVAGGTLDRVFGTDGHYVRIGGPADRLALSNQPADTGAVPAELMVGLDFLYLTRLGLRHPHDKRVTDTLTVVDAMLARDTPNGRTFYRYDLDGYGEWVDGSGWPVRRFGIGRPWPLLAGERGHYELLAGGDPRPWLQAMLGMRGRGGLLPEQVWDTNPVPWRDLEPGHPSGSAMPLAWAHSELVKLAVTMTSVERRPVERLSLVEARYPGYRVPQTEVWRWRTTAPVHQLPAGRTLVIEDTRPFVLHLGYDGWRGQTINERDAQPLPLGMFGVTLAADELAAHHTLQFVRRYPDGSWDPQDTQMTLGVASPPVPALQLPLGERGAALAAGTRPHPR